MKDLCSLLSITQGLLTAYHPQTDGQTERVNQEIEQYLRIFVNHQQNNWSEWTAMAQFAYNDKVHTATSFSPFYMTHGQDSYKGTEPRLAVKTQDADQFVKMMEKVQEEAEASLKAAAEKMKIFYDQKRNPARPYKVGDLVYLEATNIKTKHPAKKLDDKRLGPFKITKKVGTLSYRLELPKNWRCHPVFNKTLLTPYVKPAFKNQPKPADPPKVEEEELEEEVECIIDVKRERGSLLWLVKWKGYPNKENTWEPKEHLKKSRAALNDFYCTNPNTPHQ